MKLTAAAALLLGLFLVGVTPAGAGYTYHDGYYWQGHSAYNRVQYYQPGYYSYGYYYPGYYYYTYQYDHAYTPPATYTPKVPAYGDNWKQEVIKYAQERDDLATYLLALQALGVRGQQYPFQQGTYGYGYGTYTPTTVNGATQYGYSYKQAAEAYGTVDLNAALQQSARLAQGVQESATGANNLFSERIKEFTSGQTTVAKIIAEGEARAKILHESKLAPSASVTVEGAAGNGTTAAQGVIGRGDPLNATPTAAGGMTDDQFLQLRTQRCGKCHAGAEAKAKLDLTKPWGQYDAALRALIMERLITTNPEKRMPRTDAGKPADLPLAEKIEFLRRCQ